LTQTASVSEKLPYKILDYSSKENILKKKSVIILILSLVTFLFSSTPVLSNYQGSLRQQDGEWFIQTEEEVVEVYFGTAQELAELDLELEEQENITLHCSLLNDKLTVISYQVGEEKVILRDAEGKLQKASSSVGHRVESAQCIGCNICPSRCPVGAITMVKRKAAIDADLCIDCGICVDICPVNAISSGE